MSSSKGVPDAWDDDWADNQGGSVAANDQNEPPKKLSKSERRRQQYEFNKKLWEEAETPEAPYFVQQSNEVPLQSGFVPQMKVLSRRPAPAIIARKDPVTGLEKLSLQEDGLDDEEEEERKRALLSAEERAEKTKREREEKQRKYDEVRQRLFGSNSSDGNAPLSPSVPGGRAGGGGYLGRQGHHSQHAERSGRGRGRALQGRSGNSRQLLDSSSSPRDGSASSSGTNTPVEGVPYRAPRGPDGSGRGGRGFLPRSGQGNGR